MTLAAASADCTITVWDLSTGKETITILDAAPVEAFAFARDGVEIGSVNSNGTVKVWDLATGEPTGDEAGNRVRSVAFSPDGRQCAVAGDDTCAIWNTSTWEKAITLTGHSGSITCVAFSPDGKRLATGGSDKTIQIRDTQTGQRLATFSHPSDDVIVGVTGVAFSPDGTRLASSSQSSVKVWDARTGKDTLTMACSSGDVVFSPDGSRLAVTNGSRVRICDAQTGTEQRSLQGGTKKSRAWHTAGIASGWLQVRRISRHHCLLDINPPDVRIRVFGSRNGTYVNGKLIGKRTTEMPDAAVSFPEHDLKDGDEVRLQRTVFRVQIYQPELCSHCGGEISELETSPLGTSGERRACKRCQSTGVWSAPAELDAQTSPHPALSHKGLCIPHM